MFGITSSGKPIPASYLHRPDNWTVRDSQDAVATLTAKVLETNRDMVLTAIAKGWAESKREREARYKYMETLQHEINGYISLLGGSNGSVNSDSAGVSDDRM